MTFQIANTGAQRFSLVGASWAMVRLRGAIQRVAHPRSQVPVLITGPTGSGKELIARSLHANARAGGRFFCVNCAAVTSTLFESQFFGHERGAFTHAHTRMPGYFDTAAGGTLFLDEIVELPLDQQAKLLRVLESRTYRMLGGTEERRTDAWIIAATNANIEERVHAGRFREDLSHRLCVVKLTAPALCEHREDIPELARKLAGDVDPPVTCSDEALRWLQNQLWPGNVRELKWFIEAAAIFAEGTHLEVSDLEQRMAERGATLAPSQTPLDPRAPERSFEEAVRECERRLIEGALAKCDGNQAAAALMLKMDRSKLVRRLKKLRREEKL